MKQDRFDGGCYYLIFNGKQRKVSISSTAAFAYFGLLARGNMDIAFVKVWAAGAGSPTSVAGPSIDPGGKCTQGWHILVCEYNALTKYF